MGGFSFFSDLISPTSYKVPPAVNVDPTQNQLDTVSGNSASFASAKDLAQQFNDFQAQQVASRLKASFPQFQGLQDKGAQVIADRLSGKLSTSDAAAVQRSSAAKALGAGTSVAGTTLRDLGISQYQAESQGLSELPAFTSTVLGAKAAPMFDFSSVFLSPQQRWQQSYTNSTNAWNVQNLKNQMSAQPAPWMKAFAGFGDSLLTAAGSYATMGTGNFSSPSGGQPSYTVGNYMQNQRASNESGGGWNSNVFNTGDAQTLAQYGMY